MKNFIIATASIFVLNGCTVYEGARPTFQDFIDYQCNKLHDEKRNACLAFRKLSSDIISKRYFDE